MSDETFKILVLTYMTIFTLRYLIEDWPGLK